MKFLNVIAVMLLSAGLCQAQSEDVESLKREVEQLKAQLARIESVLQSLVPAAPPAATVQAASYAQPSSQAARAIQAPAASATTLAGFRLSGDFRFRLDAAIRSASPQLSGLQNIRGRYRLRLNADREIAPDLSFHGQLSTGAANNGITFDQDFAGGVSKHPFMISEAYIDYHPNPDVSIRGGKLENIYADNFRFYWDDDVRFNGFNERFRRGPVEFRAGQYFFINPNAFSVPAGSTLAALAGRQPGRIARASQMYHQGVTFLDRIDDRWRQQLTADAPTPRSSTSSRRKR